MTWAWSCFLFCFYFSNYFWQNLCFYLTSNWSLRIQIFWIAVIPLLRIQFGLPLKLGFWRFQSIFEPYSIHADLFDSDLIYQNGYHNFSIVLWIHGGMDNQFHFDLGRRYHICWSWCYSDHDFFTLSLHNDSSFWIDVDIVQGYWNYLKMFKRFTSKRTARFSLRLVMVMLPLCRCGWSRTVWLLNSRSFMIFVRFLSNLINLSR